jgi:endonuclease I
MPPCPSRLAARPARFALRFALGILCACAVARAFADSVDFEPSATYYSTATGTGATLKQKLNDIIDGNIDIGYNAARSALQITDAGPVPPSPPNHRTILTVYDRTVLDVTSFNVSGISGWDPDEWNREHTWPQSRGTSSGLGHSDLFNLRPALVANNSERANFNYGGAYGTSGGQPDAITIGGSQYFYAGNVESGVVARQSFYMDVRYDGSDGPDLQLVNGNPNASINEMGDLARLVEWHFAVVPTEFERKRNQIIFDSYQHNRDPFIDHPEWVWTVFVDQANDSSLALQGGVVGAAGATTLNVDLGRRLIGSALPAGQSVTLNKSGVDGTYYSVTAAGAATSSINGRYNAFTVGTTGTKAIAVGLTAGTSTATAGARTGTVTIDNLDVTAGGGAASGANDGNDVVNVSLSVLDHANASFAGGNDLNSLNLDFGTLTTGSTPTPLNFSIFNLAATAGFTAGLDLDGIIGSGDTSRLNTNLSTFSGASTLAAAASRAFAATLDTSIPGAFSASYVLSFSDENLVGAANVASLTLNLMGSVQGSTPNADFNSDGFVDAADLIAWQRGVGLSATGTRADGDANGDHAVDMFDLDVWNDQFGSPPPMTAAAATVPEPATTSIAVLAFVAIAFSRRRAQ